MKSLFLLVFFVPFGLKAQLPKLTIVDVDSIHYNSTSLHSLYETMKEKYGFEIESYKYLDMRNYGMRLTVSSDFTHLIVDVSSLTDTVGSAVFEMLRFEMLTNDQSVVAYWRDRGQEMVGEAWIMTRRVVRTPIRE